MRAGLLLPSLFLLLLAPGAALAGPRVTLTMENATLHTALRGLSAQTGYLFTGQGGLGQPGYREQASARRVRLDWKDVPLGKALRELQNSFQVAFAPAGATDLWVRSGMEYRRAEAEGAEVAVSLPRIQQSELFRTVGGRDAGAPDRRLTLALSIRAVNGDVDTLGNLTRLALVDDSGRTQPLSLEGVTLLPRLPDERRVSDISTSWNGTDVTRLRRLEGEIQVFDQVRELRVPIPLPAPNTAPTLPLEATVEGMRVRVLALAWAGSRMSGRVRLEWAKDGAMVPVENMPVRLLARLENGDSLRAPSLDPTPVDPASGVAELHVARELPGRAKSLELLVAVRGREARSVPFRLENVALPFGQPLKLTRDPQNVRPDLPASHDAPEQNAPLAFRDPRGGSLRLPALPPAPDGGDRSLAVGLSRKEGAAWSPTRWVELDPEEIPLRLTGLAPGVYRVRLRVTLRNADGSVQPSPDAPARTLTIRAGAETDWSAGK